jgi:large subunit ribosomal protein L25
MGAHGCWSRIRCANERDNQEKTMSQQIELIAEQRSDVGKGASRRLRRRAAMVPGIVYGGGEAPVNVALIEISLSKAIQTDTFFSQILALKIGASKSQVIARDLQRHPASNKPIHIDFQRVLADQEITVEIPIHFINEAECIGVKEQKGLITHHVIEVEVTCLPARLPEFIDVDVRPLQLGQIIHLSDLKLPEGVVLEALEGLSEEEREEQDVAVVSVHASTLAAEVEADEAAAAPLVPVAAEATPADEADEANED